MKVIQLSVCGLEEVKPLYGKGDVTANHLSFAMTKLCGLESRPCRQHALTIK